MNRLAISAIATFALASSANAAILSVDLNTTGDGLVTRDTLSGLEWLDLTQTTEMSYDYVVSQLTPGGQFAGWQVASVAQVQGLYTQFGFAITSDLRTATANDLSLLGIMNSYLGDTYGLADPINLSGHQAFTGDLLWDGDSFEHRLLQVSSEVYLGTTYFYDYTNVNMTASSWYHAEYLGTFLVRPAEVPVPAAAWLFMSGVLGLASAGKRKRSTASI